ncbi:AI-2E family transporter, partial [Halobium palmae]
MDALPWELDRDRLAWWLVVLALVSALAFAAWTIVGTVVLGLFVYYGARPVFRRLNEWVGRGVAAAATLLLIVLPTIVLLSYVGLVAWQELTKVAGSNATRVLLQRLPGNPQSLSTILQNPQQFAQRLDTLPQLQQGVNAVLTTLGVLSTGLLHLGLALTFAYFLYSDGDRLRCWVRAEWGRDSATYGYLDAVDRDLGVVYFGNVLTVAAVVVLAVGVYNGFAYLSPPGLSMPFPTLLAILTGLATFVPVVVGKVVYLPAAGYLFWETYRNGGGGDLWWPIGFLVVAFLVLDLLPMTFIRGEFSGRTIHSGMTMLAYILGATVFGWYGLFLGPLILVCVVQAANVLLPELLDGRRPNPAPSGVSTLGSNPFGLDDESWTGSDAPDGVPGVTDGSGGADEAGTSD